MAENTEAYPDGTVRVRWHRGEDQRGDHLLHGREEWYYENGAIQYEATWSAGRKTGVERYRQADGSLAWEKQREGETMVWTQYWPGGGMKSESHWRGAFAHGPARVWDRDGTLASEATFRRGEIDGG